MVLLDKKLLPTRLPRSVVSNMINLYGKYNETHDPQIIWNWLHQIHLQELEFFHESWFLRIDAIHERDLFVISFSFLFNMLELIILHSLKQNKRELEKKFGYNTRCGSSITLLCYTSIYTPVFIDFSFNNEKNHCPNSLLKTVMQC